MDPESLGEKYAREIGEFGRNLSVALEHNKRAGINVVVAISVGSAHRKTDEPKPAFPHEMPLACWKLTQGQAHIIGGSDAMLPHVIMVLIDGAYGGYGGEKQLSVSYGPFIEHNETAKWNVVRCSDSLSLGIVPECVNESTIQYFMSVCGGFSNVLCAVMDFSCAIVPTMNHSEINQKTCKTYFPVSCESDTTDDLFAMVFRAKPTGKLEFFSIAEDSAARSFVNDPKNQDTYPEICSILISQFTFWILAKADVCLKIRGYARLSGCILMRCGNDVRVLQMFEDFSRKNPEAAEVMKAFQDEKAGFLEYVDACFQNLWKWVQTVEQLKIRAGYSLEKFAMCFSPMRHYSQLDHIQMHRPC